MIKKFLKKLKKMKESYKMKSISVKPKWQNSENLRNNKCQSVLGVGGWRRIFNIYTLGTYMI